MSEVPSLTSLRKLKVAELRLKSESLGLSQAGLKADLVQRVHDYYAAQAAGTGSSQDVAQSLPISPAGGYQYVDPQLGRANILPPEVAVQAAGPSFEHNAAAPQVLASPPQGDYASPQAQMQAYFEQAAMQQMHSPPAAAAGAVQQQQQLLVKQNEAAAAEAQRQLELEQQRHEEQKLLAQQREQERIFLEQQQRQLEEQQQKAFLAQQEADNRLAEEQRQLEMQQKIEQQRLQDEHARLQQAMMAEEQQRLVAEQQIEENRRAEHQKKLEEERFLEQQRIEGERQLLDQQKMEEERRFVEQQRMEEERRLAEQQRMEEEKRLAEQQRMEEERRLAEEQRMEEERRLAEQQQMEDDRRIAEQQRMDDARRLEEQQRMEEERRLAEHQRMEEERMISEQQRMDEERRLLEQQRMEEEMGLVEQQRLDEEARLEEQKQSDGERLLEQHTSEENRMAELRKAQQKQQELQQAEEERRKELQKIEEEQNFLEQQQVGQIKDVLAEQQPPSLMSLKLPKPTSNNEVMEDSGYVVSSGTGEEYDIGFTEEGYDVGEETDEAYGMGSASQPTNVEIPRALEEVLSMKEWSQLQNVSTDGVSNEAIYEADVENDELNKPATRMVTDLKTKEKSEKQKERNRRRKKKKQKNKQQKEKVDEPREKEPEVEEDEDLDYEVEYIQDNLYLSPADPNYYWFSKVFEQFKITEEEPKIEVKTEVKVEGKPVVMKKYHSDSDHSEDEEPKEEEKKKPEPSKPGMSRKKLRQELRIKKIAELKQTASRPEVVEMHDVTAQDPDLLVHLKSTRNTVPVPRHWCFKRKYLQGKRGIEKPPFQLPEFIQRTGIMEMRQALQEKEDQKTLKTKMREKIRPKMGKIDIDYQKLHDAFFRWQTKPPMTAHGDLYYEGKEFETRLKEKKPGDHSDDLRTALGMPIGVNANKCPPPWLIAMQRYGPPPSYPNLKIPGLNAPIPEGCSFGYHAGGWGKPPVDERGKPIYGDVFGKTDQQQKDKFEIHEEVDKSHWGEMESESEESSSSEEEEGEEEEEEEDKTGVVTPAEGLATPSGLTSIPAGMETPEVIELRKKKIEEEMEKGSETPALYHVLPEKKAAAVGALMMGSAHGYDIGTAKRGAGGTGEGAVEISLDPSELDLDTDAMAARYEQQVKQNQIQKEDLSDMVAEHVARQKHKRRKQTQDVSGSGGKTTKKYKEFKF